MQTIQPLTRRPRVYSVKGFAEVFDLSERTVRRLIADSKISTVRLSQRRIGIPVEEADRMASVGLGEAVA
jgi:hypothetical protein